MGIFKLECTLFWNEIDDALYHAVQSTHSCKLFCRGTGIFASLSLCIIFYAVPAANMQLNLAGSEGWESRRRWDTERSFKGVLLQGRLQPETSRSFRGIHPKMELPIRILWCALDLDELRDKFFLKFSYKADSPLHDYTYQSTCTVATKKNLAYIHPY